MKSSPDMSMEFRDSLSGFTLDVAVRLPGRGVTAIFGPSGCGKTTMLRCVAGLHRPAEGFCRVDGDVWQDKASFRPVHKRPIGYVFQEASLFSHLSVRGNLGFWRRGGLRLDPGQPDREIIDMLGISPLLDRSPRHLSGGERQRVAIGRALLSEPRLLLMDEPLSALDRQSRDDIMPFLERLHARLGLPILYVTHDMGEVERLADHLVLLEKGSVRAAGPLNVLQTDPDLPLGFRRDAAVGLDAIAEKEDAAFGLTTFRCGPMRLLVPGLGHDPGTSKRLRVAAADVSLAIHPSDTTTLLNTVPVAIVSVSPAGEHEVLAVLAATENEDAPRLLARVTRLSWHRLGLTVGQQVFAQIKSVALAS